MDSEITQVAERLRTAHSVVALTGAGVSEESGIPTFRDPQTGLWARYDPLTLATAEAFSRDPKLVWDWYEWRRGLRRESRPNAGHFALAEIGARLVRFVLITQNIDGLHAMAGSPDVLELHGNIFRNKCSLEGTIVDLAQARPTEMGVPACPNCGAYVRPDVVWFGEALPRQVLDHAFRESERCDVFLSIGTSAVVEPAASLARIAKGAGAFLVEINPAETPLSPLADVILRAKSGIALSKICEEI